jgi:sulfite reductase alpha subunit-like flavoprotein
MLHSCTGLPNQDTSNYDNENVIICSIFQFQQDLFSYCNRMRRTTLEVLQDFPEASSHVTIEYLFELIPAMQPRAFSIASSLLVSST